MRIRLLLLQGSESEAGESETDSVALNIDAPADAERVFMALSEKGAVMMPIAETFWALRFGLCVDQFGIPWMINCGKPA